MIWMNKKSTLVILISNHPAHQINMWKQLAKISDVKIFLIKGRLHSKLDYFNKYSLHSSYVINKEKIVEFLNSKLPN